MWQASLFRVSLSSSSNEALTLRVVSQLLHGLRGLFNRQGIDELNQESRDSVGEVQDASPWCRPLGNLETAAVDQIRPVDQEKFV